MKTNLEPYTYAQDFKSFNTLLKSNYYAGKTEWLPCDQEMYDYFLNVLPPRYGRSSRFAVIEPLTHNERGEVLLCFKYTGNNQYAACYLGNPELREFLS